MPEPITWHRPEYRDHADQLISLTQVASLAGVTRAAVSNWRRRHDFPAPAMTAGRTVWVVRAEAEQWIAEHRPKGIRTETSASETARLARAITALEARERRQAADLNATRKKLHAQRDQLAAINA